MCDLDEGEWPEYVRYVERALARAAERRASVEPDPFAFDGPVPAEA